MLSPKLLEALGQRLEGPLERVGFILPDDQIVEVANISKEPDKSFRLSVEDIERYIDVAVATWHTHPTTTKLLSGDDYLAFRSWSHVDHYIIASDGIAGYRAEGRTVVSI